MHALRRVALLSAERSRAVKLELARRPAAALVEQPGPGRGAARSSTSTTPATPLSIGFNARYLLDALSATRRKEVRFGLRDGAARRPSSRPTDDEDALAVVMPMRL